MWIRVTASPLNRMSTRPASLRWVGQVVGSVLGGHPGQVVAPSGPPGGECTLCLREWAVAVVLIDLTLMIEPRRASQRVVERTRVEVDRGRLLDEVLDILDDPLVSDADAGWSVHVSACHDCRPPDDRQPSGSRVIGRTTPL